MNNKFIQILDNGEVPIDIPGDFVNVPMYFKQGLTGDDSMKLREGVIVRLLEAKKHLPKGWNFKIWDGYRPLSVQEKLYKGLWDLRAKEHPSWKEAELKEAVEKFVAFPSYDPKRPSPHNTGGAVDLTIINAKGEELPMGSEFDEFHERSYGDYFGAEGGAGVRARAEVGAGGGAGAGSKDPMAKIYQENRTVLKEILVEEGFAPYKWEWWHLSYGNQDWAKFRNEKVAIYGSVEL